jgi:hypothetical protein
MKKLVVLGTLMAAASLVVAQSPQTQKKATTTFTAKKKVRVTAKTTPPPVVRKENTQGVLPRAARGGNPFQMLNPKAPPQYGRAEDSVELDPETGKWKGIKLFTINF